MELHHPPPQVIDQVIFSRLLRLKDGQKELKQELGIVVSPSDQSKVLWFVGHKGEIQLTFGISKDGSIIAPAPKSP